MATVDQTSINFNLAWFFQMKEWFSPLYAHDLTNLYFVVRTKGVCELLFITIGNLAFYEYTII